MVDVHANRKSMILLLIVFVLPVILAWFALQNDWFNRAATNKGELINPPLDAASVLDKSEPAWRILYVMPSQCDTECENALYSIEQVWIALGRASDRARATVVVTSSSDRQKTAQISDSDYLHLLNTNDQNVKQVFKDASADGIFLVDTMNNIMMRYPLQQEKAQAVLRSRDILADLKKLLKLSRIG